MYNWNCFSDEGPYRVVCYILHDRYSLEHGTLFDCAILSSNTFPYLLVLPCTTMLTCYIKISLLVIGKSSLKKVM